MPALIAASTRTGRCGPCCSTAPTGKIATILRMSSAAKSCVVRSHHQCDFSMNVASMMVAQPSPTTSPDCCVSLVFPDSTPRSFWFRVAQLMVRGLDQRRDRVHRDAHDRRHDQAGENQRHLEAARRDDHQVADAPLAGDGLGRMLPRKDAVIAISGWRNSRASSAAGRPCARSDRLGTERPQHVAQFRLDGRDAGRDVHGDREEADQERGDHRRRRADAEPDHQDRDQRDLRDAVKGDQERIEAVINVGRGPMRIPSVRPKRSPKEPMIVVMNVCRALTRIGVHHSRFSTMSVGAGSTNSGIEQPRRAFPDNEDRGEDEPGQDAQRGGGGASCRNQRLIASRLGRQAGACPRRAGVHRGGGGCAVTSAGIDPSSPAGAIDMLPQVVHHPLKYRRCRSSQRARPRQVDLAFDHDAAGTGRHHQNAVGEEDGFPQVCVTRITVGRRASQRSAARPRGLRG